MPQKKKTKKIRRLPPHFFFRNYSRNIVSVVNLSFDGGGVDLTQAFFIYFFTKTLSLLDHTLRLTKRILILAIFYHAENLVYKKFYYIKTRSF